MNAFHLLIDTSAAAARLNVSEDWLQRKAAAREVPCVRLGRLVRFSEGNLAEIVGMFTVPAMASQPSRGSARTAL